MWATQISHLPMPVDMEKKKDWVSMQVPLSLVTRLLNGLGIQG